MLHKEASHGCCGWCVKVGSKLSARLLHLHWNEPRSYREPGDDFGAGPTSAGPAQGLTPLATRRRSSFQPKQGTGYLVSVQNTQGVCVAGSGSWVTDYDRRSRHCLPRVCGCTVEMASLVSLASLRANARPGVTSLLQHRLPDREELLRTPRRPAVDRASLPACDSRTSVVWIDEPDIVHVHYTVPRHLPPECADKSKMPQEWAHFDPFPRAAALSCDQNAPPYPSNLH